MAMRPDYLIDRPDGSVLDTRYVYARGDRVRITQGPPADREWARQHTTNVVVLTGVERGMGFEPTTTCLEGRDSTGLSYPRVARPYRL